MGQGETADGRQEREPLGRVLMRRWGACNARWRLPTPLGLIGSAAQARRGLITRSGLFPLLALSRSRSERRSQGLDGAPGGNGLERPGDES